MLFVHMTTGETKKNWKYEEEEGIQKSICNNIEKWRLFHYCMIHQNVCHVKFSVEGILLVFGRIGASD